MNVIPFVLLILLVQGSILGLGAVAIRRYFLKVRDGPDEDARRRILDELDQLDLQIGIFNERLKRVEDGSPAPPGRGGHPGALDRDE